MILLDGKATAEAIRAELKTRVDALLQAHGRAPGLAVILVGDDPASQVYVRMKEKGCAEAGVVSFSHRLEATVSQGALEALIDRLNADPAVDGILLQLPLPRGLDSQACLERIAPDKDVDGFHPENMGRLALGLPGYRPCTPAGVVELLRRHGVTTAGKRAVVLGRSNIVGKPMALMLLEYGSHGDATTTVVHSRTPLEVQRACCREADIVVAAVGRPLHVKADWIKDGAVVVDVGIHRTATGLVGDCDFEAMKDKCAAISPVPGGVGPMTIAQLLTNTVAACAAHLGA
ncbi:bifunctional methylenetetrahydrofolate dehydrogenase/methenyltetrahydrofolate cyclohydrolase FolD [Desulfocurvus sp.]|jgi:methylenetetrahydrofolate dehydrogenase (NADP+)/methenyltetrahydrofolate cyclohydrolase|uniref:bifunctional methylenetetrahydrofolate dehydrogenase/methenyltetrahydrofolate cyclohydrolase FolD n=1 Tax=Desulfocurvus sp. TaxID=2871698 RepID=UPI0025B8EAE5|nr:bifunctional methylenetetrahydrofolate dehydrogenase/methenyltetrahydrofolate cyclohydrolase FolD [Desulfocurvus sp.]MCK9240929.1 bifunctional methylenetetrahydrofolate dehydrogenase/methenyltetrahydrofolate cyclohydrolase FolD [Desulfocurvus sp.]